MTLFTVLGASGFIGRHLVSALHEAGHDVFAPKRDDLSVFDRPLGNVIYAIGLTADFRTRPFDTVNAHVSFLATILERADFDSLVYLSSTRVYQGIDKGVESAPLLVQPKDPSDLYNLSKLMGESLCLNCGKPGVRVVRLSNVLGIDPYSNNFVFTLVQEALNGEIVLCSAPSSSKDYIHLDDVVDLLPRIALEGKRPIYNVASGIQLSHEEWVKGIVELIKCGFSVKPKAPLQKFPIICIAGIQADFSYVPRTVIDILPSLIRKGS